MHRVALPAQARPWGREVGGRIPLQGQKDAVDGVLSNHTPASLIAFVVVDLNPRQDYYVLGLEVNRLSMEKRKQNFLACN